MPIALPIGAAALGAIVLFFSIAGLLRVLRESEVARLPVKPEQGVTFREPGSYVLHVSQPRLGTPLNRASFALRSAGGAEVRSSPSIFRTTVSGMSTARISVRNFEIEQPGSYRLLVANLDPGADLSRCELIFTRPFAAAMFGRILGIVVGGVMLIGGIVLTALKSAGKL